MIPVILSGGSGTRLWPVSRKKIPKQFANIFEQSLQEMTFLRCMKINTPWLVAGEAIKTLSEITLKKVNISKTTAIYEPNGKNTAPAIAVLCRVLQQKGFANEVVGVFPSDHLITKVDRFVLVTQLAEKIAQENKIVTLGIEPDYPETGYGYIQAHEEVVGEKFGYIANSVKKFHEKPDLETAKKFLSEGNFFWNAGIFIFKVQFFVEQFKKHQPEIWNNVEQLKADLSNLKEVYDKMPNISIDYALIEKLTAKDLACIPCELGWSDVGSWDSVSQYYEKKGFSQVGTQSPVLNVDSNNNFVFGQEQRNYAFVGMDDVILVDTPDVTLVVKKGQSQKVKDIVESLNKDHSLLATEHVFDHRPWGYYEILRNTPHFKSKVIQVRPGEQLSYQSHSKREEHWVITRGAGEVILNEKTISVKPGTHVHVPLQAKHRMKNTGTDILEFVEVQLGSYFGEDDIIRYKDDYGR